MNLVVKGNSRTLKFDTFCHFQNVNSNNSPENLRDVYGTAWKVSKYGVISFPYFLVFGLNLEIYGVNLRIQFEYRKMQTSNNSVFGLFSHLSVFSKNIFENFFICRLFIWLSE